MKLRVKELRKQKDFTLEVLAEKAGTSKGYVSQIERGLRTPSMAMLNDLAVALGVRVPELYDVGDLSDDIADIIEIMANLSPEDRKNAIRAAAGFLAPKSA